MSLADHWDGGWLKAGWHHVKITAYEITSNPKKSPPTPGVEFQFVSVDTGAKGKEVFWLTEAALCVLASFARDCGMTKEEARNYDPHNSNAHRAMVGLECWVEMVKKGDYHEVNDFRSLGEGEPPPPKIDRSGETPAAEARNDNVPF